MRISSYSNLAQQVIPLQQRGIGKAHVVLALVNLVFGRVKSNIHLVIVTTQSVAVK